MNISQTYNGRYSTENLQGVSIVFFFFFFTEYSDEERLSFDLVLGNKRIKKNVDRVRIKLIIKSDTL